jgi:hypothetical protein
VYDFIAAVLFLRGELQREILEFRIKTTGTLVDNKLMVFNSPERFRLRLLPSNKGRKNRNAR